MAAAAFALLAISAVFAFSGAGGDLRSYGGKNALVLDVAAAPDSGSLRSTASGASEPVVIRPPARPAPPARKPARSRPAPASIATPAARAAVRPAVRTPAAVVVTPQPAPPAVAAVQPRTGDALRRIGDDVSGTVQTTGSKLSDATAPLGPPVSEAVQKVLDQIAVLLKRTTDGLGGTLDKVLPKRS